MRGILHLSRSSVFGGGIPNLHSAYVKGASLCRAKMWKSTLRRVVFLVIWRPLFWQMKTMTLESTLVTRLTATAQPRTLLLSTRRVSRGPERDATWREGRGGQLRRLDTYLRKQMWPASQVRPSNQYERRYTREIAHKTTLGVKFMCSRSLWQ